VPADGYWSNQWMKVPVGFGNINPRPSADILLTQFFKSDAQWNESGWKNPQFDQLVVAARETDFAKRKAMYADMQTLIHEKGGLGIPVFIINLEGMNSKVKGIEPVPLGAFMNYTCAVRLAGRVSRESLRRTLSVEVARDRSISMAGPPLVTRKAMNAMILRLILRRLLQAALTLLLVSAGVFFITNLLPGDAAQAALGQAATPETVAALRLQYGLDLPAPLRYAHWLGNLLSGNPGMSLVNNVPVAQMIGGRLPASLMLAVTAADVGAAGAGAGHRLGHVPRLDLRSRGQCQRGVAGVSAGIPGGHRRRDDLRGQAALAVGPVACQRCHHRGLPSRPMPCRC
jgi:hypothetical protein